MCFALIRVKAQEKFHLFSFTLKKSDVGTSLCLRDLRLWVGISLRVLLRVLILVCYIPGVSGDFITVRSHTKKNNSKFVVLHIIKAYRGNLCLASLILNLNTRWRWVVSLTVRQVYPLGRSPWCWSNRSLVGFPSVDVLEKKKPNYQMCKTLMF
jgi:hypothetical protein